ncbi:hypothetical protein O181_022527 [Austropuccinia psidii MF-1]|uniref:Uncharacterized protein n=1 Tax=Austropuccinia psidii MF-1 TaxID=1389203 RepID=A0A9Q3CFM7_9BASI|nr:hypothetical protein [Austropuccinia psidii MF-1]
MVLVHNRPLESHWGLPLKIFWNGPYKVINQVNNEPYEPKEMDGTKLTRKFAAIHIKTFYPRGKIVQSSSESENERSEEIEAEESIFEGEEIEQNEYDCHMVECDL